MLICFHSREMLSRINFALQKDSSEGFLLEVLNSFQSLEQTYLTSWEFWTDWGKNPLLNVKMHFAYSQGKLKSRKQKKNSLEVLDTRWTQQSLLQTVKSSHASTQEIKLFQSNL